MNVREVIVIKEESQDDIKHDLFRQTSSFGHDAIITTTTTLPGEPHSSRSRTSTPATFMDKVDNTRGIMISLNYTCTHT